MQFLRYVRQGTSGGWCCRVRDIDISATPADAEFYLLYLSDEGNHVTIVGHTKVSHGYAVTNDGPPYQQLIAIQVVNRDVARSGLTKPQVLTEDDAGPTAWTNYYTGINARVSLLDLEEREFGDDTKPLSALFEAVVQEENDNGRACDWIDEKPDYWPGSPPYFMCHFANMIDGGLPAENGLFVLTLFNKTLGVAQNYDLTNAEIGGGSYVADIPMEWETDDEISIQLTHEEEEETDTYFRSGLYYHTLP